MSKITKLEKVVDQWWSDVCEYVRNALLFLDNASAECLHWHGGIDRMLNAGAINVRQLAVFENVGPAYKKAVIIVSSQLTNEVIRTIITIIKGSSFTSCTVISALPSKCHDNTSMIGDEMFLNLERQMLVAMGSTNYTAQVLHIPVFASCLLPDLFILPSLSNYLAPVSSGFLLFECRKNDPDMTLKSSSSEKVQAGIKALAFCLHSLLDSLELRSDIFSLGQLSQQLGNELENICQLSKRKGFMTKASVLLIDRSLDLAGPLSQAAETLLGKMLRVLPHLPGHVSDVSVNMAELSSCPNETVFGFPLLASGCIAHKSMSSEMDVLNALFFKRTKEALMDINRKVVHIGVSEGLTFDSSKQLNIQKSLKKCILSYKDKPLLVEKHSGLFQQALGVIQTVEHPRNSYIESLQASEKLLMQNASLSSEQACDDLIQLISHHKNRGYKLQDVLTLISFLHTLTDLGTLNYKTSSIQASFMEALLQNEPDLDMINNLVDNVDDTDDDIILMAVKKLFYVLENLGNIRNELKNYWSIFESGDPALPAFYKPLLKQVLEDVFSASEMADLEFHSSGLRDYIKSSISMFMSMKKPLPKDNPLIIIFVLGGVTANEIKMIRDISSHQKMHQILIGSTQLLTPNDVMNDMFHLVKDISISDVIEDL